jgi:PPOX class probable FMN-dependent enzyme
VADPSDPNIIGDLPALEALFGHAGEASIRKEISYLHPVYREWIERSPFAVLATAGPSGLDASPRGDPPGLVTVLDEHTLLLPERRGNNRIDSLRNILADPRVALLFLIPGIGETLRVNGRARISVAPALLQQLSMQGMPPKCIVEVKVEAVYFQCARALHRSRLWEAHDPGAIAAVPTPGRILEALTQSEMNGREYDNGLQERQRSTLY